MTRCIRCLTPIAAILAAALPLSVQALEVGQCPSADPRGLPFAKTLVRNRIPYRINAVSFDDLPGVSRDAGATAVVMGADTWNEQTTTADFRYVGSTSLPFLPDTSEACDQLGVDSSIVTVTNACLTGGFAQIVGRCWRAAGGGDAEGWSRFEILIYTRWRLTASTWTQGSNVLMYVR